MTQKSSWWNEALDGATSLGNTAGNFLSALKGEKKPETKKSGLNPLYIAAGAVVVVLVLVFALRK
jgi:hypothetical protein